MRTLYFITLLILSLISCHSEETIDVEPDEEQPERIIVGDIDTALIISQLGIQENASRPDLIDEKNYLLSERLDTLELTYYFAFCICQDWINSYIHEEATNEFPDLDKPDPRGQVEFNLDKHGYYIEPAADELTLNWRIGVNGTTIRFIGREYKAKRLPQNSKVIEQPPPMGRVFRYYSYEILKPYTIWGPNKFVEIDPETGDSLTEPTQLTVH